jgi:hypothetical protein
MPRCAFAGSWVTLEARGSRPPAFDNTLSFAELQPVVRIEGKGENPDHQRTVELPQRLSQYLVAGNVH